MLAACAATPNDVRDTGKAISSTSPVEPAVTARCLQRYWEAQNAYVNGQLMPTGKGGYELQIRQEEFGVIALYDLQPGAAGRTAVRMWYRDGLINNATSAWLDGFLVSCR